MRSYARHSGSSTSIEVLRRDLSENSGTTLAENTVSRYLEELRQIFVIEDIPAWNPNLRSKTAIRTANTRYFSDSSIGVAALGIGPADLINDLNSFGLFFEPLCMRDLKVYAESLDGGVYHYRDKSGSECDAVVHLRNGRYGLIQIKLGSQEAVDYGALKLQEIAGKLDLSKMKPPSFLMVLTAVGRFAYKRKDGVFVVPIGCLKN